MTQKYTMIEWLSSIINNIASEPIFHDTVYPKENTLLSVLTSPKEISERRIAIRKYVILAVDKLDGQLMRNDIIWDFLDYHNQFSVIELFLISNTDPDEDVQNLNRQFRIRFIKLLGGEHSDGYSEPTPEIVHSLSNFLLGEKLLDDYFQEIESIRPKPDQLIHGGEAEKLLREIYSLTILLALAEQELLTGSEQRWVIGHDTTGKISAFAGTYAVKRYPIENKWIDCYIPDQKYLALTMNRASEAYQTLLHLETAVEYESTYSLLKTLSLQLIRYFGSWLSGQQTKFGCHLECCVKGR